MKSFKAGIVRAVVITAALVFMSCSSNSAKLISISVTPVDPVNAFGTVSQYQFTATGTFSDGKILNFTSEVTWSSSNPAVATIGTTAGLAGQVTVLTAGTTTITAVEPYNRFSSSSVLHIGPLTEITITPADPLMASGKSHQFTATATYLLSDMTTTATESLMSSPPLFWSSSETIALVSKGLVTAELTTTGTTTITAKAKDGTGGVVSGTTTLTVTPSVLTDIMVTAPTSTMVAVTSQPFTATGTFVGPSTREITSNVRWHSSNTGIVTVSNDLGTRGQATAVASGTAIIKATDLITRVTGTMEVTVH